MWRASSSSRSAPCRRCSRHPCAGRIGQYNWSAPERTAQRHVHERVRRNGSIGPKGDRWLSHGMAAGPTVTGRVSHGWSWVIIGARWGDDRVWRRWSTLPPRPRQASEATTTATSGRAHGPSLPPCARISAVEPAPVAAVGIGHHRGDRGADREQVAPAEVEPSSENARVRCRRRRRPSPSGPRRGDQRGAGYPSPRRNAPTIAGPGRASPRRRAHRGQ